jgi:hypothetical protein
MSCLINAEYLLGVECSGSHHLKSIPWELTNGPPETPLADLTGRLVCQRCGPNGPLPHIAGVSR